MIVVANFSFLENSLLQKVAEEVGIENRCFYVEGEVETDDEMIAACKSFAPALPKTVIINLDSDESVWLGLLTSLKANDIWRFVPVMGFGFLEDTSTVIKFYGAGGASCIRKPHGYEGLKEVTQTTMRYWLDVSFLPSDFLGNA